MVSKRPAVPCRAHSSRTGMPRKKYAMHGAAVCDTHGGRSPQVRWNAEKRQAEVMMLRAVGKIQRQEEVRRLAPKPWLDTGVALPSIREWMSPGELVRIAREMEAVAKLLRLQARVKREEERARATVHPPAAD